MLQLILFVTCIVLFLYYSHFFGNGKFIRRVNKFYELTQRNLAIQDAKTLYDVIKHDLKQCGGMFYNYYIGFGGFCVISKAEDMELLFNTKQHLLKPYVFYSSIKDYLEGLISLSGDVWKRNRKLVISVFNTKSLNHFTPTFFKVANKMCQELRLKHGDGQYFHCELVFSSYIFQSAVETLTDMPCPFQSDLIHQYCESVETQFDFGSNRMFDLFRALLPVFGEHKRELKNFTKMARKVIQDLSEYTKKNKEQNSPGERSLGDKTYFERIEELNDPDMLYGEITVAIVAGYETTSCTVCHATALLAIHQDYQEKVYQEMMEIYGDSDRLGDYQDFAKMVWLEACIYESLRLYPTAPMVARTLTEDVAFSKRLVPKGSIVCPAFWVLHRDETIWEKPNSFYPEHFLPAAKSKRHPYSFLPFSSGARQCIGYRYAMMSMKSTMSQLLRHFRVETDMQESELAVNRIFTLDARHIRIRLIPRHKEAGLQE